jgi:hypothetical protein
MEPLRETLRRALDDLPEAERSVLKRGNAERRALFVGLWAPTFWQIGTSLERHD